MKRSEVLTKDSMQVIFLFCATFQCMRAGRSMLRYSKYVLTVVIADRGSFSVKRVQSISALEVVAATTWDNRTLHRVFIRTRQRASSAPDSTSAAPSAQIYIELDADMRNLVGFQFSSQMHVFQSMLLFSIILFIHFLFCVHFLFIK